MHSLDARQQLVLQCCCHGSFYLCDLSTLYLTNQQQSPSSVTAGFKSRALRVGGAADGPARVTQPALEAVSASNDPAKAAMPILGLKPDGSRRSESPVSSTAAPDQLEVDTAAGRQRHTGEVSLPSRNPSPVLGDFQDSNPPEKTESSTAQPCNLAPNVCKAATPAVEAAAYDGNRGLASTGRSSSSEDDSVPLVSSKLAAKLGQGTPLAGGRPADHSK